MPRSFEGHGQIGTHQDGSCANTILVFMVPGMTLSDYMKANRLSRAEMAEKLAVTPEAVRKWMAGERVPRPEIMARIFRVTGRKVTPSDFMCEAA